jgi:hypothetical protein
MEFRDTASTLSMLDMVLGPAVLKGAACEKAPCPAAAAAAASAPQALVVTASSLPWPSGAQRARCVSACSCDLPGRPLALLSCGAVHGTAASAHILENYMHWPMCIGGHLSRGLVPRPAQGSQGPAELQLWLCLLLRACS